MSQIQDLDIHELSRQIIHYRWNNKPYKEIATQLEITESQIQSIKRTEAYQNQVWAEYGRSPHIFNRHKEREDSITHISAFFGIPRPLADEILGKDHKEPEIIATQLEIDSILN